MKQRPAVSLKQDLVAFAEGRRWGTWGHALQVELQALDQSYPLNQLLSWHFVSILHVSSWQNPSLHKEWGPSFSSTSSWSAHLLTSRPQFCFIFPPKSYHYQIHYIWLSSFQRAPWMSLLFTAEPIVSRTLLVTEFSSHRVNKTNGRGSSQPAWLSRANPEGSPNPSQTHSGPYCVSQNVRLIKTMYNGMHSGL